MEDSKKIWSKYRQNWGAIQINKTKLRKKIKFDYSQLLEKTNQGWKLIFNNKKLLSVSSILKSINDYNLFGIPQNILEYRRELGKRFMENCYQYVNKKEYELDDLVISELERKHLTTFFKWLIDNEMKIMGCEKVITNGCLVAFLDFVVRTKGGEYFIIEVKLRNSLEVKPSDLFQLRVYCEMFEVPGILVIIGDNGEIKTQKVTKKLFVKELANTRNFYKQFGIDIFFNNKIQIGD